MQLADLLPDATVVIALEPDELGLYIICSLSDGPGRDYDLGPFLERVRSHYSGPHQNEVIVAVREAWAWLEGTGLLILSARYPSSSMRNLSRAAIRLAKSQTARAVRTRGLAKEHLHPAIREDVWALFHRGKFDTAVFEAMKAVEIADRRDVRLECSTRRETGNCDNRRSVSAVEVETRALEGICKYLLDPEIVADWLRTYHEERETLRRTISNSRAAAESTLANIEGRLQRVMKLYEDGMIELEEAKPRLQALKQEKREAEDALAATQAGPLVTLHPGAIESYREQLASLHRELSEGTEAARTKAVERIRSLMEKIVIRPNGEARGPFDVEIHGRLASFLRREGEEGAKPSVGTLVAGTGFEPVTFRL